MKIIRLEVNRHLIYLSWVLFIMAIFFLPSFAHTKIRVQKPKQQKQIIWQGIVAGKIIRWTKNDIQIVSRLNQLESVSIAGLIRNSVNRANASFKQNESITTPRLRFYSRIRVLSVFDKILTFELSRSTWTNSSFSSDVDSKWFSVDLSSPDFREDLSRSINIVMGFSDENLPSPFLTRLSPEAILAEFKRISGNAKCSTDRYDEDTSNLVEFLRSSPCVKNSPSGSTLMLDDESLSGILFDYSSYGYASFRIAVFSQASRIFSVKWIRIVLCLTSELSLLARKKSTVSYRERFFKLRYKSAIVKD